MEYPTQIRASIGSAITLGLLKGKLDADPSTAYLMTYTKDRCIANCRFCPQARESQSKSELLSRVSWPVFSTQTVIEQIANTAYSKKIKRICFQALNYPSVFDDLSALIRKLKQQTEIPISVSCQPINIKNINCLKRAGAERIGIGVDAATKKIFENVKGKEAGGPYCWANQIRQLKEASIVFGAENVSVHLIVGLGETEKEACEFIQECKKMGVSTALFAFTPVSGTLLSSKPQPKIESYRRVQLARYLIMHLLSDASKMHFNDNGRIHDFGLDKEKLILLVQTGHPFLTSGCPDCNRPFYNERASGPIYNYPRILFAEEIKEIKRQLE